MIGEARPEKVIRLLSDSQRCWPWEPRPQAARKPPPRVAVLGDDQPQLSGRYVDM